MLEEGLEVQLPNKPAKSEFSDKQGTKPLKGVFEELHTGEDRAAQDVQALNETLQRLKSPGQVWTEGEGHNATYLDEDAEQSATRLIEAASSVNPGDIESLREFVTNAGQPISTESMSAYLHRKQENGNVLRNVLTAGVHAINYLRSTQNRSGKSNSQSTNLPGQSGGTSGTSRGIVITWRWHSESCVKER